MASVSTKEYEPRSSKWKKIEAFYEPLIAEAGDEGRYIRFCMYMNDAMFYVLEAKMPIEKKRSYSERLFEKFSKVHSGYRGDYAEKYLQEVQKRILALREKLSVLNKRLGGLEKSSVEHMVDELVETLKSQPEDFSEDIRYLQSQKESFLEKDPSRTLPRLLMLLIAMCHVSEKCLIMRKKKSARTSALIRDGLFRVLKRFNKQDKFHDILKNMRDKVQEGRSILGEKEVKDPLQSECLDIIDFCSGYFDEFFSDKVKKETVSGKIFDPQTMVAVMELPTSSKEMDDRIATVLRDTYYEDGNDVICKAPVVIYAFQEPVASSSEMTIERYKMFKRRMPELLNRGEDTTKLGESLNEFKENFRSELQARLDDMNARHDKLGATEDSDARDLLAQRHKLPDHIDSLLSDIDKLEKRARKEDLLRYELISEDQLQELRRLRSYSFKELLERIDRKLCLHYRMEIEALSKDAPVSFAPALKKHLEALDFPDDVHKMKAVLRKAYWRLMDSKFYDQLTELRTGAQEVDPAYKFAVAAQDLLHSYQHFVGYDTDAGFLKRLRMKGILRKNKPSVFSKVVGAFGKVNISLNDDQKELLKELFNRIYQLLLQTGRLSNEKILKNMHTIFTDPRYTTLPQQALLNLEYKIRDMIDQTKNLPRNTVAFVFMIIIMGLFVSSKRNFADMMSAFDLETLPVRTEVISRAIQELPAKKALTGKAAPDSGRFGIVPVSDDYFLIDSTSYTQWKKKNFPALPDTQRFGIFQNILFPLSLRYPQADSSLKKYYYSGPNRVTVNMVDLQKVSSQIQGYAGDNLVLFDPIRFKGPRGGNYHDVSDGYNAPRPGRERHHGHDFPSQGEEVHSNTTGMAAVIYAKDGLYKQRVPDSTGYRLIDIPGDEGNGVNTITAVYNPKDDDLLFFHHIHFRLGSVGVSTGDLVGPKTVLGITGETGDAHGAHLCQKVFRIKEGSSLRGSRAYRVLLKTLKEGRETNGYASAVRKFRRIFVNRSDRNQNMEFINLNSPEWWDSGYLVPSRRVLDDFRDRMLKTALREVLKKFPRNQRVIPDFKWPDRKRIVERSGFSPPDQWTGKNAQRFAAYSKKEQTRKINRQMFPPKNTNLKRFGFHGSR